MKRTGTKRLLASFVAIIIAFAMMLGTTFAWFTDSSTSSGNKIEAGTLKIDLELLAKDGTWSSLKGSSAPIFNYNKWEPGYTDVKVLKVENEGTLALKWKAKFVSEEELSILADVIDVYVKPSQIELTYPTKDLEGYTKVGTLKEFVNSIEETTWGELAEGEVAYLGLALKMSGKVGNEYQGLSLGGAFDIKIVATQLTAEEDGFDSSYDADAEFPTELVYDTWDGTVDTDWFFADPDATEFSINSAEAFAGLTSLIEGTYASTFSAREALEPVTFEDKIIKLDADIDLLMTNEEGEPIPFDPIGSYRFEQAFMGTFDGQGHTIYNLNQNSWELDNGYYYNDCGLGLFGAVVDATIKNVTIDGADISGESAICGTIAAYAENTTFENITIKNANVADYQYYAGGVVGWASGNCSFINCVIDESVSVAAQWGDFDNSIGGLIGGIGGSSNIVIKDCTVACRIDAYNDVTSAGQWYAYRRAGMLVGNSGKTETIDGRTVAIAPQLTCENVTVIYGDWANYTYCKFSAMGYPYVRVQAGVSNSAYSNPRYGHPTDANGNEVVDDNHVHNEGEDHNLMLVFDQLYGGATGVYGNPEHEGVTVVYNNK